MANPLLGVEAALTATTLTSLLGPPCAGFFLGGQFYRALMF